MSSCKVTGPLGGKGLKVLIIIRKFMNNSV